MKENLCEDIYLYQEIFRCQQNILPIFIFEVESVVIGFFVNKPFFLSTSSKTFFVVDKMFSDLDICQQYLFDYWHSLFPNSHFGFAWVSTVVFLDTSFTSLNNSFVLLTYWWNKKSLQATRHCPLSYRHCQYKTVMATNLSQIMVFFANSCLATLLFVLTTPQKFVLPSVHRVRVITFLMLLLELRCFTLVGKLSQHRGVYQSLSRYTQDRPEDTRQISGDREREKVIKVRWGGEETRISSLAVNNLGLFHPITLQHA